MQLTFFEVFGDPARDGECTVLRMGSADVLVGDTPRAALSAATLVITINQQEYRIQSGPGGGLWSGWVNPDTRRQRQVRFAQIVPLGRPSPSRRLVLIEGTLQRGEAIQDIRPDAGAATLDQDGLLCFGRGARILTAFGDLPVEHLRVGDLVHTLDNGLQPVRWVGSQTLGPARLYADPELVPVCVKAGALGPGLPATDVILSPHHRVLVGEGAPTTPAGVLIAVAELVNGTTITRASTRDGAAYHHVLFDAHELVFVEGMPSESFYPNPVSMAAMSGDDRAAVCAVAPQLGPHPFGFGPTARPCITGPARKWSVA